MEIGFSLATKVFVWRRGTTPLIFISVLYINVWLTSRSGRFAYGKELRNPVTRKVENIVEHTIAVWRFTIKNNQPTSQPAKLLNKTWEIFGENYKRGRKY